MKRVLKALITGAALAGGVWFLKRRAERPFVVRLA